MRHDLTGLKIRRRRRAGGLTQGELARRAGISPSYLNLIEQNKRPIAGALLDRLAAGLGVARAELDDEPERRLIDRLNEVAADPALAGPGDHHASSAEIVGRYPEWADLLLKLYRAFVDRNEAVLALADRL